jgi:hypothetical protein
MVKAETRPKAGALVAAFNTASLLALTNGLPVVVYAKTAP